MGSMERPVLGWGAAGAAARRGGEALQLWPAGGVMQLPGGQVRGGEGEPVEVQVEDVLEDGGRGRQSREVLRWRRWFRLLASVGLHAQLQA